jgi:hypothetical protein
VVVVAVERAAAEAARVGTGAAIAAAAELLVRA